MSFIKDIINDFTKGEPPGAENLRKQAGVYLFGGIALLAFFLIYHTVIFYSGESLELKVFVHNHSIPESVYSTPFGEVITGGTGILKYKSNSILDYYLFATFEFFNLLDFLLLLYIGVIIYKGLRSINEQDIFRISISRTYIKVGFAFMTMSILKILYDGFLISLLFAEKMDYQYDLATLPKTSAFYFLYFFIGLFILSFAYFMNKGEEIQQEQDLTI